MTQRNLLILKPDKYRLIFNNQSIMALSLFVGDIAMDRHAGQGNAQATEG